MPDRRRCNNCKHREISQNGPCGSTIEVERFVGCVVMDEMPSDAPDYAGVDAPCSLWEYEDER